MKTRHCIFLLIPLLVGTGLRARMELITGIEDIIREIDENPDQVWLGLGYTAENRLLKIFSPYAKGMVGLDVGDEYLLAVGLAFIWQPLEERPEFSIVLQSGPSYTNVGPPHSGTHFNWTSELAIRYRFLMLGYSHTSNGGIYSPNSGLDMFLIGFTLP